MSDYIFALESHLDGLQNRTISEMQRIATAANQTVWLTGGAMRDMLRGASIHDLDFTVEHDAVKLGRNLAQSLHGEILEEDSLKRQVEMRLPGGLRASVANARTEKYSKPGGKPQIGPATIHEDLSRRDFTINAIGLFLNRGARGLLVDPTNGQADLQNRELRTTNSMAFYDDPSRVYRLIRFKHSLGMEVSARTQSQLENAILGDYLTPKPSALAAELRALSAHESAAAAIAELDSMGLLKALSPALTGTKTNPDGLARYAKLSHTVFPAGNPEGWLAFLAIFLEKLGPREFASAVRALELSSADQKVFKKLDSGAKKLLAALKSVKIHKPSQVWEVLRDVEVAEAMNVLCNTDVRVVHDRIRAYYQKYLPASQEVTDEQVAAATKLKPGTPKFAAAKEEAIVTRLNSRPRKVELEPPPPPTPAGRGRPARV